MADDIYQSAEIAAGIYLPSAPPEFELGLCLAERIGGIFPIQSSKSPACRYPVAEAVNALDVFTIRERLQQKNVTGLAVRITNPRTIVIDCESEAKAGIDGVEVFYNLCDEAKIDVPTCPIIRSCSDGKHSYFTLPAGMTIAPSCCVIPGIDILTAGANVILPGSQAVRKDFAVGKYSIEVFAPIPEMPLILAKLIVSKLEKHKKSPAIKHGASTGSVTTFPTSLKSKGDALSTVACLCSKSGEYKAKFNHAQSPGDPSKSAYLFHMTRMSFFFGINDPSILRDIAILWCQKYGEEFHEKQWQAILSRAWTAYQDKVHAKGTAPQSSEGGEERGGESSYVLQCDAPSSPRQKSGPKLLCDCGGTCSPACRRREGTRQRTIQYGARLAGLVVELPVAVVNTPSELPASKGHKRGEVVTSECDASALPFSAVPAKSPTAKKPGKPRSGKRGEVVTATECDAALIPAEKDHDPDPEFISAEYKAWVASGHKGPCPAHGGDDEHFVFSASKNRWLPKSVFHLWRAAHGSAMQN